MMCAAQNFLGNLTVNEFCKSVYICRSSDQKCIVFFDSQCIYIHKFITHTTVEHKGLRLRSDRSLDGKLWTVHARVFNS